MSKFVVRQECSYVRDGAAVHHSKRALGQVVELDDARAVPLVASGCLEAVAKPARTRSESTPEATDTEAEGEAPVVEPPEVTETEPPTRRRRGRIHDDG